MNKVLIVTYYWPPSGGAGVQRWLKFAKYLPEFGWEPLILTVDPAYAAYPVTDYSLVNELPPSLKVYSTPALDYFSIYKKDQTKIPSAGFANNTDKSFKGKILRFVRGNFFIPDPRKGWNNYAVKRACELIKAEGINHVITTSPPHSTQLIGLRIKKKFPDIKWIADLRDPWTDIYYYKQFYPTLFSKAIDLKYEKSVLKNSDKIITVGSSLKTLFSSKIKDLEQKVEVITNGYDQSDFNEVPVSNPSRFTLTYVGTLSDIYPIEGLIPALKTLHSSGKDFLLRFVGTVSEKTRKMIESEIPAKYLEFLPYAIHSEAIKYMMNTSLLILIIPLHQSSKSIITGKIFEYLASGKPILCLGPVDGDAAEIISKCKAGRTFSYFDTANISKFVKNIDSHPVTSDKQAVQNYSRYNLGKHIAEILNSN
jgi:glycosyltransferase involved in cell wall biosynthesis